MEGEVIKYFITQGAFAVLFTWLLIDTRKDSKQREEKYQLTIDKLADNINIVEDIKEDVEEIKNKLNK
ncbi:bacteriocin [Clostridium paraputrificum]|uniref:BhlA/UviB family holin-like peptide n=1 Tax=Clostridium paraputrificum TaxID=29363 RepID=UPI000EA0B408|nr:BhlA/UviB family holin-like peptide [Clostridium paraputrificum]RKI45759.1 bacteriocin [Clostridium paraputrificum]